MSDQIDWVNEIEKESKPKRKRGRPRKSDVQYVKKSDKKTPEKKESNNIVRDSTIRVSKQLKVDGKVVIDADETETIGVHIFQTKPSVAKMSKGLTLELGKKYHFARFDVGCEIPSYLEQFDQAMKLAEKIIEERIQHEVDELNNFIEGSNGQS